MSYFFAHDDGYITDAASVGGWHSFVQWAKTMHIASLDQFIRQGHTDEPSQLASALRSVHADRPDIEDVLRGLQKAAEQAQGVLIISDGSDNSDDEEETP